MTKPTGKTAEMLSAEWFDDFDLEVGYLPSMVGRDLLARIVAQARRAAELQADLARAKADNAALMQAIDNLHTYILEHPVHGFDVPDEIWVPFSNAVSADYPGAALLAEVARVKGALEKYDGHKLDCRSRWNMPGNDCTCGWDALVKQAREICGGENSKNA